MGIALTDTQTARTATIDDYEVSPLQLVTLYTRILAELRVKPRYAQEALARRLNVTMRTAQRHLTVLEDAGVITASRDRKPFTYTINTEMKVDGVTVAHAIDIVLGG